MSPFALHVSTDRSPSRYLTGCYTLAGAGKHCDNRTAASRSNEATYPHFLHIFLLAFLLYEHSNTFIQEVELFWFRRLTGASVLFLLNRYFALLNVVLTVAIYARRTEEVCLPLLFPVSSALISPELRWSGESIHDSHVHAISSLGVYVVAARSVDIKIGADGFPNSISCSAGIRTDGKKSPFASACSCPGTSSAGRQFREWMYLRHWTEAYNKLQSIYIVQASKVLMVSCLDVQFGRVRCHLLLARQ